MTFLDVTLVQVPMVFALVAALATLLGLLAVVQRPDWSARHSGLFALTAAGMLLTLTLLRIAPEAFERTTLAPQLILAGVLGGLAMSHLIRACLPDRGPGNSPWDALTPLSAIALHSFIDGVIFAITFETDFELGFYASSSLILHEIPEGVIAFALLRRGGMANWWAFLLAFLAAGLTTPLGVLLSSPVVQTVGQAGTGGLFALSAGLLLYVATGPLMAPMRDTPPVRGLLAVGFGVTTALLISLIPGGVVEDLLSQMPMLSPQEP